MESTYPFPCDRAEEWITFQRKQQARVLGTSGELEDMIGAFDLDDYKDRLDRVRRRIEINERFEEPDRVPLRFSVSGSFFCKLQDGPYRSDVNLRDYYSNMALDFQVQLMGLRWTYEELRDDHAGGGLHAEFGPIGEGVIFGLKMIYPDDTSPWIVREIRTKDDMERFIRTEVPHPEEHPGFQFVREMDEEAKELVDRAGGTLGGGAGLGMHPPLSAACGIMEPVKVVKLMYTDPDLVHRFFEKLADTKMMIHEYGEKISGQRSRHFGLADDHMLMLTPDQYREFEMPYVMRMYRRFGPEGRHLHGDGPNDHLFDIMANEVKLTNMDIGGFSSLEMAAEKLKGKVNFSGGLNCKDFYMGTSFELVKPRIDACLMVAGRGGGYTIAIGGETYVGADPALLRKAARYVDRAARLPWE